MSVANTSNWFSKFDSSSVVLGTTLKRIQKWEYILQNICSQPSTFALKSSHLPNPFSPTPHPTLMFTFSHCCYIFFPCWSLLFSHHTASGCQNCGWFGLPSAEQWEKESSVQWLTAIAAGKGRNCSWILKLFFKKKEKKGKKRQERKRGEDTIFSA